jgi:hypothetical protein
VTSYAGDRSIFQSIGLAQPPIPRTNSAPHQATPEPSLTMAESTAPAKKILKIEDDLKTVFGAMLR